MKVAKRASSDPGANSIYPLKEHLLVASTPAGGGSFSFFYHRLEGFLDNGVSTAYQRVYVAIPLHW
jgi:hypothetical protein